MTIKIPNKTDGLLSNTGPTGIKYEIVPVEANNALVRIRSSLGPVPLKLEGYFTSIKNAQSVLTQFLIDRWNESDSIAAENKAKRANRS